MSTSHFLTSGYRFINEWDITSFNGLLCLYFRVADQRELDIALRTRSLLYEAQSDVFIVLHVSEDIIEGQHVANLAELSNYCKQRFCLGPKVVIKSLE